MVDNVDVLLAYAPYMRNNIKHLCLLGKLGLMPVTINDIIISDKILSSGHHLTIKIPYAGKKLSWEVIFNPDEIEMAPDFEFNDDYFLMNPDINFIMDNVPSWNNWNIRDEKSLTLVLKEFLQIYKKQQLEKLLTDNIYSKIKEEYEALVEKNERLKDEVEVIFDNNNVHLLISLQVNFEAIPRYIQPEPDKLLNPGEDYVLLRMSYLGLNRVTSSLLISPRMEQLLNMNKNYQFPAYNKEMPVVEYFEVLVKQLDEKIQGKVADYQKRKRFMAYWGTLDPDKLVNFDEENMMTITLVYIVDDYEYVLDVSVDYQFPHKRPRIFLSHECDHPDCKELVKNFPWNKNENEREIINNILNFFQEELPSLRKNHRH